MGLQPLAELGSFGGRARESLPSLFQNWALRGRNESGGKGREGHSPLREQPLQRKVQGGELGLGVAGPGRPLGRLSAEGLGLASSVLKGSLAAAEELGEEARGREAEEVLAVSRAP